MEGNTDNGFTLIEISIVLVIIGLLIGGIMVGMDLIESAKIRSQIKQIETYRTAVNTFRTKYDCLPGDCASASQLGFLPRGQYAGEGDGNGILEGVDQDNPGFNKGTIISTGENAIFWQDLGTSLLLPALGIVGTLPPQATSVYGLAVTGSALNSYFPVSSIGSNSFISTYSHNSINYFSLSAITGIFWSTPVAAAPSLSVTQAMMIDTKLDDGLPQSGMVTAQYNGAYIGGCCNSIHWAAGGGSDGASDTSATIGSSTTCYDNSAGGTGTPGIAGNAQHYSMEISKGSNVNCALSFRFQ